MILGTAYFITILSIDIAIYLMIDSYLDDGTWDKIHNDTKKYITNKINNDREKNLQ